MVPQITKKENSDWAGDEVHAGGSGVAFTDVSVNQSSESHQIWFYIISFCCKRDSVQVAWQGYQFYDDLWVTTQGAGFKVSRESYTSCVVFVIQTLLWNA